MIQKRTRLRQHHVKYVYRKMRIITNERVGSFILSRDPTRRRRQRPPAAPECASREIRSTAAAATRTRPARAATSLSIGPWRSDPGSANAAARAKADSPPPPPRCSGTAQSGSADGCDDDDLRAEACLDGRLVSDPVADLPRPPRLPRLLPHDRAMQRRARARHRRSTDRGKRRLQVAHGGCSAINSATALRHGRGTTYNRSNCAFILIDEMPLNAPTGSDKLNLG
jgi:hypothetical protein